MNAVLFRRRALAPLAATVLILQVACGGGGGGGGVADADKQEAETLAQGGITELFDGTPDVAAAAAAFDQALAKDPDNELAVLGSSLASLGLLPTTSAEVAQLLADLGISFDPNALITSQSLTTRVAAVHTSALSGMDAQDLIDAVIIPALDETLAALAGIGSGFNETVNGSEIDDSDILAFRAALTTAKGLIQTANAYDASVPDASVLGSDLATVLATESAPVGTVRDAARLTAAKNTLASAMDLSVSFIDALQAESDDQVNDLIQKSEDPAEVAAFKTTIQDTKASLQGSAHQIRNTYTEGEQTCTDTQAIDLAAFYGGGVDDLRNTDTDPTVGGLFPGSTDGSPVTTTECSGTVCGNGQVESGEQCDDGNTTDGDGCSANCTFETAEGVCGDGVIDAGEECDDGNATSGDGCSATCTTETTPVCGNEVVEGDEECDDGNTIDGDGCSANCTLETVEGVCGDGVLDAGEECDDGNTIDGDGCSATCTLEATIDGAMLFSTTCGGCHTGNGLGTGSISDVTGATAAGITNAIASVGAMGSIDLTAEEIQAIADALAP